MDDLERYLRDRVRDLGRGYERTRRAYAEGKGESAAAAADLPTDDAGRAKLVCRRYAEQRAVEVDAEAKPACFDPDHTDCVGCVEDIQSGIVETW